MKGLGALIRNSPMNTLVKVRMIQGWVKGFLEARGLARRGLEGVWSLRTMRMNTEAIVSSDA